MRPHGYSVCLWRDGIENDNLFRCTVHLNINALQLPTDELIY